MRSVTKVQDRNAGAIDNDWRLSVLSRHNPDSWGDYVQAYRIWKNCWFEVFRAIGKSYLAHSNAFTESDAITALFYKDQCAALLVYKLVDFSEEVWQDDAYFEPWPKEALALLTQKGSKILICSHYTVDKDFRKDGKFHFPFAVKDFIAGVSFKYFLSTNADAMTGNMRNAKGVQKSFYKWGATALMKDVPCNGEMSDLVGVFRENVDLNGIPELAPQLEYVWRECAEKIRVPRKKAA